uniref:Calponin-homology (CH) domain-containing protein n=1 Tax=Panagrolaimus sp. ES5 TaxID=591445 RepID=A0AC34GXB5_9BILA
MCEIESLETLQLRSNSIQRLPSTIHLLKSLSFLDLSGNHIQSIPPTLFYLRLKVLLLGGNKITTIPREIRQLENCLLELDLSYNCLIELPSDITLLKTLRVLNLSNNELIDLPQEIGFMQIRYLNIQENCLTALPLDFYNLAPYLINLKVNGNPFVSPPVNVILKGREHIFKWLKTQAAIENSQNCNDWNSFNRCTTLNATLRRPDKILVQSQLPKTSDPTATNLLRKADRRPRQNRFNTVGGSDSGYASTGDENRLSHEMIMSKGSLEEINEISCNVTSSLPLSSATKTTKNQAILDREASGDLAKEVMLAYAETIIEKKMAARGAPLSPPSSIVTSPTTAAAIMDVSNNNVPAKKVVEISQTPSSKAPEKKFAPKAVEEASDESQASDIESVPPKVVEKLPLKMSNNNNLSPALSVTSTSSSDSSEIQTPIKPSANVVESAPAMPKPSTAPSKLAITTRSSTTPPESKPTAVKKVTVSRIQPTTTTTTTTSMRSGMPKPTTTTTSTGLKKPSLSTSKITPAPTSSIIPPRKSDPTKSTRLTSSTINLTSKTTKSIDSNIIVAPATNGTLRKQQPLNSMSKSAISGSTTLIRKQQQPTAIGSQPNLANGSTTGSLVESMRKVIEGKLAGTKLPTDRDRLSQELSSGVYLCNFANKIRIRAVPTVFTPSEANLSPLKAKRNADGFVAACKRLGVPENSLCTSMDIIDRNNLLQIARTVLALNKLALSNGSITTVASRV